MNAFWWAIMAACIWGIVPILEKTVLLKIDPFVALFYRCFGVLLAVLFLGIFVVKPEQMKSVDVKSVGILILAGFLASFVANIAFYHGLKIGDVSRVVPVAGIYPLIAFVLGILFFREAITLPKLFGVTLIVSGVWFLR